MAKEKEKQNLDKKLIDEIEISDECYDDMIYRLETLKSDMENALNNLRMKFMEDIEQMAKEELSSFDIEYKEENEINVDLESKEIKVYKVTN